MPTYPARLELHPIGDWPGEFTKRRRDANFYLNGEYPRRRTPIGHTMSDLDRELEHLGGKNPRLYVAITSDMLRLDGKLRAGAEPWHPGVILEFDTKRGAMRYPSDQFVRWEDNLRAIALTLEALRAIERWGVSHGQQYGGFLAIESARAAGAVTSEEQARRLLYEGARMIVDPALGNDGYDTDDLRVILRRALFHTHPDHGGDPDLFQKVTAAEKFLREAGKL